MIIHILFWLSRPKLCLHYLISCQAPELCIRPLKTQTWRCILLVTICCCLDKWDNLTTINYTKEVAVSINLYKGHNTTEDLTVSVFVAVPCVNHEVIKVLNIIIIIYLYVPAIIIHPFSYLFCFQYFHLVTCLTMGSRRKSSSLMLPTYWKKKKNVDITIILCFQLSTSSFRLRLE